MRKDVLIPPWIYTAIPGKVFVRLGPALSIGDGDHSAIVSDNRVMPAPAGAYLMHFPFRTYKAFEEKIRLAASDFGSNPHLPETYGWQIRRWLRIAKSGNLYDEYLQQFVPDEQVDRLIEEGTLALDDSIRALQMEDAGARDHRSKRKNKIAYLSDFFVRQIPPARQANHVPGQEIGVPGLISREFFERRMTMQAASPPAASADPMGGQFASDRFGACFLEGHDHGRIDPTLRRILPGLSLWIRPKKLAA